MKGGGSCGTAGGLESGLVGRRPVPNCRLVSEPCRSYALPLPLQYPSSGDPFPLNVFVCLFLLICKGLSARGPVAAGGPDANSTITFSPLAKISHKRRKPKSFLLGNRGLKTWSSLNEGSPWSESLAEAGTKEGRWAGTGPHTGSGEQSFAGGGI